MTWKTIVLFAVFVFLGTWLPERSYGQACQIIYEGIGCETMRCGCRQGRVSSPADDSSRAQQPEPERQPAKAYDPFMPKPPPSPDWSKVEIPDTYVPPRQGSTPVSPWVLDELSCNSECRFQRALSQSTADQFNGSGSGGSGGMSSGDASRCIADEQRAQEEMMRISRNSGEGICAAGRASEQIGMIYKNFLLSCPSFDPTGSYMTDAIQAIENSREVQRNACN